MPEPGTWSLRDIVEGTFPTWCTTTSLAGNDYYVNSNITNITNNSSPWVSMGTISDPDSITVNYEQQAVEEQEYEWYGGCGLGLCGCMGTAYRDRRRSQPVVGSQLTFDRRRYKVYFTKDYRPMVWMYYAKSERMARAYHDHYWPDNKPIRVERVRNEVPIQPAQLSEMARMREGGTFVVDPERMY